ncbi:MAG: lipoyl(octanoyl) transferase LipB [Leptonema sp. (in: Bacteria)]|nr:lipoyl(octanoyl) transferase LipB [Leptonema sp. (in: bacteria)]
MKLLNIEIPVHILNQPMRYTRYQKYSNLLRQHRKENIVFCEHYPVVTTGIQTNPNSLLISSQEFAKRGIDLISVKRGGDATAHEIGQIVIYPHIDLRKRKINLTEFIRELFDISANTVLNIFGLRLFTDTEAPGLYNANGEKLVSLGVEIRAGFSSSGVAINYSNSLKTFSFIHPCGYSDLKMESLIKPKSEKRNDLEIDSKKKEFCSLWADQFIHRFSLYL